MHRYIWRLYLAIFAVVCTSLFFVSKDRLWNKPLQNLRERIATMNSEVIATMKSEVIATMESEVIRRVPERKTLEVKCDSILKGDSAEIKKANNLMANSTRKNSITDSDYIRLTRDCDNYKRVRQFGFHEISEEEKNFPVAYSILLYKDVEQAERLLRSIYSVVNVYCFHVDMDSKTEVHKAIQGIADCLHNVFVVSRREYVVYKGFTRLQADINCMENLMQRKEKWRYFINLPSQQFPLKTNKEIVKILKIYNGANDIEGITGERAMENRFKFRYVYKHIPNEVKPRIFKTNTLKDSPPYNVTVVKGSAYGIFSRKFVEFVIYNRTARDLLDWFRDVLSPDEYYWATLQHNPQLSTPGAFYRGKPDEKPWLAAYASWRWVDPCHGKFVRAVCVFGVGDRHLLVKRNELFVNKFYLDYQPLALECFEEWHFNRTANEKLTEFNATFYESLPFIKNCC